MKHTRCSEPLILKSRKPWMKHGRLAKLNSVSAKTSIISWGKIRFTDYNELKKKRKEKKNGSTAKALYLLLNDRTSIFLFPRFYCTYCLIFSFILIDKGLFSCRRFCINLHVFNTVAKELLNNKSMEDIIIPLQVEKETASGVLALVQYSRAQKQVFQKVL